MPILARLMTRPPNQHSADWPGSCAPESAFPAPQSPKYRARLDRRQARHGRVDTPIEFDGPDKSNIGLPLTGGENAIATRRIIF